MGRWLLQQIQACVLESVVGACCGEHPSRIMLNCIRVQPPDQARLLGFCANTVPRGRVPELILNVLPRNRPSQHRATGTTLCCVCAESDRDSSWSGCFD